MIELLVDSNNPQGVIIETDRVQEVSPPDYLKPSPEERLTALEIENEDLWLALAQVELGGVTL